MESSNAPHTPTSPARDYAAQLRRAGQLASTHPASREILAFYSRILSFQKSLDTQIAASAPRQSPQFSSLRDSLDLTLLLPHFCPFLALIKEHAPQPLAVAAHELLSLPSDEWIHLLTSFWRFGGLPEQPEPETGLHVFPPKVFGQFFPRAFLAPYAARLAARSAVPPAASTPSLCPLCAARPFLGILRPEGDGGKRSLLCSFCGTEWNYRRILCPCCGESDEPKLPVFIADQFPHIRTESCDTCRAYLRTIDLTKDGHAVPPVDDLAALPLSLWAHEHAYTRLHPNLLAT